MGAWLAVFPCRTINSAIYLAYGLSIIYLSFRSIYPLALTLRTHGLVPIVITSNTNGYVSRSGPRCCCLLPLHFHDGSPGRTASFRRTFASLMRLEGVGIP